MANLEAPRSCPVRADGERGVLVPDTALGELTLPFLLVEEDDLCLLTSLLEENEAALPCGSEENKSLSLEDGGNPDEFDELFDADGDGESYTEEADSEEGRTGNQEERLATLFGDVEDLTDDEVPTSQVESSVPPAPAPRQEKTNQELQGNPDCEGWLSPIYSLHSR